MTPVDSRFLGQSHNDLLAYPMNERSSTGRSNSDDVNGLVLSKTSAANIYARKPWMHAVIHFVHSYSMVFCCFPR